MSHAQNENVVLIMHKIFVVFILHASSNKIVKMNSESIAFFQSLILYIATKSQIKILSKIYLNLIKIYLLHLVKFWKALHF